MISFKVSKYLQRLVSLLLFCIALVVTAQDNSKTHLNTVSQNEFGQWERINRGTSFSNNGTWLQYGTITNDKNKTLFLTNTKTKKTKENKQKIG